MKREEKIGAIFGITGGVIGLIIVASIFQLEPRNIVDNPLELLSLIAPALGFSAWFGHRSGTNISKNRLHPILAQLWSGILTITFTIIVHAALMSILLLDINYFTVIPMAIIMSFVFGAIPILLLSLIFGLIFKPILNQKS
ncbi:MAG: hypothetical protein Crog4KO_31870 [Crocinitomicaceae bacterium]